VQKKLPPALMVIDDQESALDSIQIDAPITRDRSLATKANPTGGSQRNATILPSGEPDGVFAIQRSRNGMIVAVFLSDRWRSLLFWSIAGVSTALIVAKSREIFSVFQSLIQAFANVASQG
jgi:hypothetical protein